MYYLFVKEFGFPFTPIISLHMIWNDCMNHMIWNLSTFFSHTALEKSVSGKETSPRASGHLQVKKQKVCCQSRVSIGSNKTEYKMGRTIFKFNNCNTIWGKLESWVQKLVHSKISYSSCQNFNDAMKWKILQMRYLENSKYWCLMHMLYSIFQQFKYLNILWYEFLSYIINYTEALLKVRVTHGKTPLN